MRNGCTNPNVIYVKVNKDVGDDWVDAFKTTAGAVKVEVNLQEHLSDHLFLEHLVLKVISHFCFSSNLIRDINIFQIFYFEKVGQEHEVQLSQ